MSEPSADTIYSSFEETANRFPDRVAIIYLDEKFDFSTLSQMVLKFSAALLRLGIQEGDRVVLYLYNIPQIMIAWLALERLGAIVVPVAPVYGAGDLRYLVNDVGAETILCMDSNFNYVNEIFPDTSLKRAIITNMLDLVPWWKRIVARGFDRVPRGAFPSGSNVHSFSRLLREGKPAALPPYRLSGGERTALVLYTGGTTGFPKGVPLSEGLFLYRVKEWRRASEAAVPLGKGVTALAAPLYHIIGEMDAMGPLIVGGETLIMLPRVVLDALFDHIQRYRATTTFAVPALYRMLLEHDRVDSYDLSSLKYCGTGGDVLPPEVGVRWLKRYHTPLYQGYGTTEFCGAICMSYAQDGPPPAGSAGKILPGSKWKLVDPDSLEPVPPRQPGELLGTSPYAVKGYWNKPEETKACFVEIDGEVWYRTRDIVHIDEQERVFYLDRSVDMIKHKGYRIAAAEIERVLQEHQSVLAACAVGVPDKKAGERIKAFVVLKTDSRGVSGYELTKWCRERLAPYKVPHYIEFRDMLPKSKVGKMLRREIRDEERRKSVEPQKDQQGHG
ncbi:MAG: long-chain fatty acid--CoA ligase [Deltaproteobacteria bacterium HGW-Deltaproteobacteria-15]|jgi:long-chain acyl-CoA synthetase|nr:MAG: long-chain fatty acid--CoA ligase [Deltaproteobacteria bacterium HGW-Deltaproteobacteria-15]